jgi:hypothetical protein
MDDVTHLLHVVTLWPLMCRAASGESMKVAKIDASQEWVWDFFETPTLFRQYGGFNHAL